MLGGMQSATTPEAIASGILLAAAVIFLFRLSFRLWSDGRHGIAMVVGLPPALLGFGLIMAGLGFGTF